MALARTEFELKLVGPAADVAAVPTLGWLDAAAAGPGSWERLASTYFDSAEKRLAAAGLSLRVREEAGARTLTAKLALRKGSAVRRLEAERPLGDEAARFVSGVAEIDRVIGAAPSDLAPIARTVTDRWSRLVSEAGALVEVSAEIGRAVRLDGDGESAASAIAEVEVELLKGDAAALFAVARRLNASFEGRLRLCARSKLDRALAAGAPAFPAKRAGAAIAPDATAADALSGALADLAESVGATAAAIVEGRDSDALRRLRVALRRLRALERVFGRALGDDELARLAARAKDLARRAGVVRDLDVFIIESLPLARGDAARLAALRASLEARRAAEWNAFALELAGRGFGDFLLDLAEAAHLQSWRASARKRLSMSARRYSDAALERRWKRLLETGAAADFARPPTLHPLRIELKKFRYAAQFFRDLYPAPERKPFFASMKALQDAFGAVNDAVVAQEIAEHAGDGLGPDAARAAGFIAGYRGAEAAAAAAAIESKWRAFLEAAPFWTASAPSGGT